MERNTIAKMDALGYAQSLPSQVVNTVITSPPYWGLRDYGYDGQWGSEPTIQAYITRMVELFAAIREALRDDGTVFLNLGDGYAGSGKGPEGNISKGSNHRHMEGKHSAIVPDGLKPKDLIGMPWRVALALQADGWYLRSDIIWHKPNSMPESVTDRPTKAHEYIFLLSKSQKYYYDADAIREPAVRPGDIQTFGGNKGREYAPSPNDPNFRNGSEQWGRTVQTGLYGRNKRSVWTVATQPFPGAHFAVFPQELITPCVLAGSPKGGLVYDPFMGAGTTALVAKIHGRDYIGSELNQEYIDLANARLDGTIKRHIAEKNKKPLTDLPMFKHLEQTNE